MTKCIIKNCTYPAAPALKTGLCMRCHSRAKKQVEAGTVTWGELVGMGLALDVTDNDPFTIALQDKMEGRPSAHNE